MGQFIFVLVFAGIVFSWTTAGIRAHGKGGSKKFGSFLLHLAGAVVTVSFLWVMIVLPVQDCIGFLCGLGELITWIIISGIVMLIWPLILIAKYGKKGERKPNPNNDELLDDIM